jgi:hypothetical protein
MTSTTLTAPATRPGVRGERLFEPGGPTTLDEVISKTWQTLAVRGNARCPVCGAMLLLAEDRPAVDHGADCAACGSHLE